MSALDEIRRQQLVRAAEGYLDLITVFADRWPLPPKLRDPLALRALKALTAVASSHHQRPHVQYLMGQALRTMERFAEAIEPLSNAARLEPDHLHVHLALGWCYKRLGRLDLAIQALEDALLVAPEEGIVHYNLACYWSLHGNIRSAVKYLTQSFDLDPNYRDLVSEEPDFDPIRNDPRFRMLTSVIV